MEKLTLGVYMIFYVNLSKCFQMIITKYCTWFLNINEVFSFICDAYLYFVLKMWLI